MAFAGRSDAARPGRRRRRSRMSRPWPTAPPDRHPLREFQRGDLADSAPAPARISKHLRLLPLVRRSGRRSRRSGARPSTSGLVARRAAGHVPGAMHASGHDCAGRDGRPLRRSRSTRSRPSSTRSCKTRRSPNIRPIRSFWTTARDSANPVGHLVLHVAGAYQRRKRPAFSDATCTACNLPTSGKTWPAIWPSAGSTCHARTASSSVIPIRDLRALRFTPAFAGLMRFRGRSRTRPCSQRGVPSCRGFPGPWPSISTCSRGAGWRFSIGSKPAVRCLGGRPALLRWTKIGLLGRALLGLGLARMAVRR